MFKKSKANIVVTGAKGQLGSYLVDYFNQQSFSKKSFIGKVFGIDKDELDIQDADAVSDFFNKNVINPSIDINFVVHCAAATDTKAIEEDPIKFYATNVLGTRNIAKSCAYNKIKMVFISTDYIYSELSPVRIGFAPTPFPVNQYGLQKLLAEREVELAYKDWSKGFTIARSSWMFGNSDRSFVEKFLANAARAFKSGKCTTKAVDDCFGRPTHVDFIANVLHDVIYDMHVKSKQIDPFDCQPNMPQISRLDWAKEIWRNFAVCKNNKGSTLATMVDIVGCKSDRSLGVMSHPGLVGDGKMFASNYTAANSCYSTDYKSMTAEYITKNFARLSKMFDEIAGERQ